MVKHNNKNHLLLKGLLGSLEIISLIGKKEANKRTTPRLNKITEIV